MVDMVYVQQDLLTINDGVPYDERIPLVHCISSDFALGAGIAKAIDEKYHIKKILENQFGHMSCAYWRKQNKDQMGYALRTDSGIDVIFNLVTKYKYYDKPTLDSIKWSLTRLKAALNVYSIHKIAMPKIGCGLDGQEWDSVDHIIHSVFAVEDIQIIVCYL